MDIGLLAIVMIGLMIPISILFMITIFHKEDKDFLWKIFFFGISCILYVASVLYLLINERDTVSLIWISFSLVSIIFSISFFCIRGFLHPLSKVDDKVRFRMAMIPIVLGMITSMVPNHFAKVSGILDGDYLFAFTFYALIYFMAVVGFICNIVYDRSKKSIVRFLAGVGIACAIIGTFLCIFKSYDYLLRGTTITYYDKVDTSINYNDDFIYANK